MHQGALGYGILNGSLGLGALIAATQLPKIRRRFDASTIIASSTIYNVGTMLVMAYIHTPYVVIPVLILAGSAWTSTMSTLNTSVQLGAPAWVTARALGTYLMTFQGGMALGSILWGFIAEHTSTPVALTVSAAGLLITLPIAHRFKILQGPVPAHTPYQWKRPAPQPLLNDPDEGPIRVSIVYTIPVERYDEFTHAIHALRGVRLRDGAIRWGIFRDALNPEMLNETFVMESWLEYLRSRERMTAADQQVRDRVWALHAGGAPPVTSHQIYAKEVNKGRV
jgi:MFS family permease